MRRFTFTLVVLFIAVVSVAAQDTVQVKAGWNLIGSVKAGTISEVLFTVPESLITSTYWGYYPGVGYQPMDTLDNGAGYWVKAKSDGIIIFNNTLPVDVCKSQAFIYQGKLYHTVKIGSQCWMAENLDVGVMIAGVNNQTDNDTTEKYCYNDDPLNCAVYGGLYQWDEAMQYVTTPGTQGLCPPGWHVPTWGEFESLALTVSSDGNALKTIGQGSEGGAGTNTSGFSALLAGYRDVNEYFSSLGYGAYMWSSTENDATNAYYMILYSYNSSIVIYNYINLYGFSIRCIKD